MPNTKSAIRRVRRVKKQTSVNRIRKSKVQELANKKLIAVQKKMADLLLLEHALEEHLGQCQNNDDDSHCPIIDSLQPK